MAGVINAHNARRIGTAAAYGGGGVSLLSASFYGLLRLQARMARRTITSVPLNGPPNPDGVYGLYRGEPLSLVVLGDSSAAGFGAPTAEETPGALVAGGLAEIAERPVNLTTVAMVGARSADLAEQVDKALVVSPDAALIMVGGNDVTHKVPPAEAVRLLIDAVRRLRAAGCEVVVGTCPDLGTIRPIQPPLRWLARRWSRQLAAAQTVAVVEAGGRTVSLGSILGPEFAASPMELFSEDKFHPSSAGYAHAAAAALPSVVAALGLWSEDDDTLEPFAGDSILPVSVAAATAANQAGSEVAATTVGGNRRGPRGTWARLRNRGRAASPDALHAAENTATGPTAEQRLGS
ncbi:SGNH/GDSL hydrolase family protein [Phytoactinopolyspora alkaliphila]|uniref:SGNH/GDSL hydrolase family protein n=1 Tax=Phytoactinopolyspora alkaliphila TaxID=1783498 RepID=A0A6N9YK06_9ACTN|nr:SGNH/GDSL hydrolase family protein [Phytoactinopolyspora alkaliphila]NED95250.1 SGNH/GDSL hydrolase family protein [Phytoactinopolyspora alkaliphila]